MEKQTTSSAFGRVPLIETYKGDVLPTNETHNYHYMVWVHEPMLRPAEIEIIYPHKNITIDQLAVLHGGDRIMAYRIKPGLMGHVLRIERVWKRKNWIERLFN